MFTQAVLLAVLPCLLAYACFSDLFTMRISNRVCLLVFFLFPLVAMSNGLGWAATGWHLLAGLAVLAVSFTLFSFGWVGGGDAKLVAAASVWFGFEMLMEYIALSCILGGGLTMLLLALRQHPLPVGLQRQPWISHLHQPTTGVPYGIALGIAGLILLPQSAIWTLAA